MYGSKESDSMYGSFVGCALQRNCLVLALGG